MTPFRYPLPLIPTSSPLHSCGSFQHSFFCLPPASHHHSYTLSPSHPLTSCTVESPSRRRLYVIYPTFFHASADITSPSPLRSLGILAPSTRAPIHLLTTFPLYRRDVAPIFSPAFFDIVRPLRRHPLRIPAQSIRCSVSVNAPSPLHFPYFPSTSLLASHSIASTFFLCYYVVLSRSSRHLTLIDLPF